MSENITAIEVSTAEKNIVPPVPPQDLSLNLDLYNYDSPDAQSCPYVLTSPRSLEACSRVGIKPVDLLHKSLAEFSDEVEPDKPLEEIVKLYDEHEQQRIILLQKCQAEREFLIWRSTSKRRSQSLSPCRRGRVHKPYKHKDSQGNRTLSQTFHLAQRRKSNDDILAANVSESIKDCQIPAKNFPGSSQRPTSWSTPTSPYYQGSRNLFVRITSPVVCAKLQTFPKAKMRLPPKDMKILEVILQKYEKLEEEEEKKAKAQKKWDREKEEWSRQKEVAEMERWKNLALKQKRSNSEELLKTAAEKDTPSHCSRFSVSEKEGSEKSVFHKRHSYKQVAKNQTKSFEDQQNPRRNLVTERVSRYEAEQKLKEIQQKQEQVRKRRLDIIQKRDDLLKRSAEEFREKLKQVKMNQQELDKAMEKWQSQVVSYQEEANMRAAEKVAQTFEQRRLKVMHDRLSKQEEHKKNMQKIEAEDHAKLQEMMAKLRSKDERCRAFKEEKNTTIEQSRQLAQAASDLRDLIRQRLDKDSFVRKSQQAALESRLLNIEPRTPRSKQNNPLEED